MKKLLRLIPYAKPLHHFIPEYVIYTFLGVLFGLVNFALLIPILDVSGTLHGRIHEGVFL